MSIAADKSIRFGMKSLLLSTANVSLFLGALAWAIRGSDAGVEEMFEAAAKVVDDFDDINLIFGVILLAPLVVFGGLIALPIAMVRLGRSPYAAYHVVGFAAAGVIAVVWLSTGLSDRSAPGVVARLSLPLVAAALALFVETGYRKAAAPYWVVAGVGLLMAICYSSFIVAVWAAE